MPLYSTPVEEPFLAWAIAAALHLPRLGGRWYADRRDDYPVLSLTAQNVHAVAAWIAANCYDQSPDPDVAKHNLEQVHARLQQLVGFRCRAMLCPHLRNEEALIGGPACPSCAPGSAVHEGV